LENILAGAFFLHFERNIKFVFWTHLTFTFWTHLWRK